MPLEIRELVVKITVEEQNAKRGLSEHDLQELKKKIVKECVDKVMEKIGNQLQR